MKIAITLNGVSKRWSNGLWAVKDISFEFPCGQLTALVGRNGSGKTTLIRLMTGLIQAEEGSLDLHHHRVGMVFQQQSLWPHLTVQDQLALPLQKVLHLSPEESQKRSMQLLSEVGVGLLAGRFPDQLSGGQQQKVALARSLAMNPDILCLDEVTSSLDPVATREIQAIILQLKAAGKTIIFSSHDLGFVKKYADLLIYMREGVIDFAGTPQMAWKSQIPFFEEFE